MRVAICSDGDLHRGEAAATAEIIAARPDKAQTIAPLNEEDMIAATAAEVEDAVYLSRVRRMETFLAGWHSSVSSTLFSRALIGMQLLDTLIGPINTDHGLILDNQCGYDELDEAISTLHNANVTCATEYSHWTYQHFDRMCE